MSRPALGPLCVALVLAAAGLVGGCGGGGSSPDAQIVIPEVCAPAEQTGCAADQKCTWIRTAASSAQRSGQLGCAPAGARQVDEACRYGPVGASTGFDDCAAGLVCLADPGKNEATGRCREICDDRAAAGSAGACAASWACGRYVSFFQNRGEEPLAGVCDPTCDPLSQQRAVDGAPACGSVDPANPDLGCYGNVPTALEPAPPQFTCLAVGGDAHHREDARDPRTDAVYRNACAPGHIVGFLDTNIPGAPQKPVCLKLCKPAETYQGAAGNAHGVGDASSQCVGDRFTADDECRYWWFFDAIDIIHPYSNNLGICWRYSAYMFASQGPNTALDTPWPSCTTLAHTDDPGAEPEDRPGVPDTTPEYLEWGCGPSPSTTDMLRSARAGDRPRITIPPSSMDAARRWLQMPAP